MVRCLARSVVSLALACALVALSGAARPVLAASEAHTGPLSRSELDAYVQKAQALGLARSRQWLRLGHYRPALFGGYTSEADAKQFFLAEDGKGDPEAELIATLKAFFSPGPDDVRGVQHPFCRFPARRRFLARALEIPAARLPVRACARLDAFLTELRPIGATLVFSSYYLNNPASAFGHTFLRLERRAKRGNGEGNDLLDSGVDYSATVDTTNALLYAFKGLLGLFPGNFRKIPYYAKVREYNDFESRDLWEYELALSPDEVELVALHLWELGSTYFAYYYLSENCSYHVLGLLEAGSPRLTLLGDLGWPVIPADTVKALFRNPGLVRRVHYRPSNRTALRLRIEGLNGEELDALARLMRDPHAKFGSGVAPARQVKVLDTALDLIDVRLARDLVKERHELGDEADLQQELLMRRAEYDVEGEQNAFAPPFRSMPHLGHGSRRFGLGGGYASDAGYYQLLHFRLALHDVADAVPGYPAWASIEFLPFTLRWRLEQEKLTLEDAALVRVESLSPWTRFERPLSFRTGLGFTRTHDRACEDCPTGFAEIGGGISLSPFREVLLIYGFGEARVLAPFDAGLLDFVRVGVGPLGGIVLRVTPDFALSGSGRWSYLPGQKPHSTWSVEGKLRLQYTQDFALGVEAGMHPESSWAQAVSYLYF